MPSTNLYTAQVGRQLPAVPLSSFGSAHMRSQSTTQKLSTIASGVPTNRGKIGFKGVQQTSGALSSVEGCQIPTAGDDGLALLEQSYVTSLRTENITERVRGPHRRCVVQRSYPRRAISEGNRLPPGGVSLNSTIFLNKADQEKFVTNNTERADNGLDIPPVHQNLLMTCGPLMTSTSGPGGFATGGGFGNQNAVNRMNQTAVLGFDPKKPMNQVFHNQTFHITSNETRAEASAAGGELDEGVKLPNLAGVRGKTVTVPLRLRPNYMHRTYSSLKEEERKFVDPALFSLNYRHWKHKQRGFDKVATSQFAKNTTPGVTTPGGCATPSDFYMTSRFDQSGSNSMFAESEIVVDPTDRKCNNATYYHDGLLMKKKIQWHVGKHLYDFTSLSPPGRGLHERRLTHRDIRRQQKETRRNGGAASSSAVVGTPHDGSNQQQQSHNAVAKEPLPLLLGKSQRKARFNSGEREIELGTGRNLQYRSMFDTSHVIEFPDCSKQGRVVNSRPVDPYLHIVPTDQTQTDQAQAGEATGTIGYTGDHPPGEIPAVKFDLPDGVTPGVPERSWGENCWDPKEAFCTQYHLDFVKGKKPKLKKASKGKGKKAPSIYASIGTPMDRKARVEEKKRSLERRKSFETMGFSTEDVEHMMANELKDELKTNNNMSRTFHGTTQHSLDKRERMERSLERSNRDRSSRDRSSSADRKKIVESKTLIDFHRQEYKRSISPEPSPDRAWRKHFVKDYNTPRTNRTEKSLDNRTEKSLERSIERTGRTVRTETSLERTGSLERPELQAGLQTGLQPGQASQETTTQEGRTESKDSDLTEERLRAMLYPQAKAAPKYIGFSNRFGLW